MRRNQSSFRLVQLAGWSTGRAGLGTQAADWSVCRLVIEGGRLFGGFIGRWHAVAKGSCDWHGAGQAAERLGRGGEERSARKLLFAKRVAASGAQLSVN